MRSDGGMTSTLQVLSQRLDALESTVKRQATHIEGLESTIKQQTATNELLHDQLKKLQSMQNQYFFLHKTKCLLYVVFYGCSKRKKSTFHNFL